MKKIIGGIVSTTALFLLLNSAAMASSYFIMNQGGKKVIDLKGECEAQNGCRVQAWTNNGSNHQIWTWTLLADSQIKSRLGRCLAVKHECAAQNGCKVQVFDCDDNYTQKWTYDSGTQQIKNQAGKCLDVHGPCMNENGCDIQVWDCGGSANQKWSLLSAPEPVKDKEQLTVDKEQLTVVYSGEWRSLNSCDGCSSDKYMLRTGVTHGGIVTENTEMSNAVSAAFGLEISAEYEGLIASASVTATAEFGYEYSETVSRGFEQTFEKEVEEGREITCDRGQLFQWVNRVTVDKESYNSKKIIEALSGRYICTTPDNFPGKNNINNFKWRPCIPDNSSGQWRCKKPAATKPTAKEPAGKVVTIKSSSGKYLDVDGPCGGQNGCKVQIWEGNGSPNQQWTLKDGQLLSGVGGLCLDVDGPCGGQNGCKVHVWECNGSPNQQWTHKDGQITSEVGGLCLDVDGPCYGENGCKVQVWECNGSPNQEWYLEKL